MCQSLAAGGQRCAAHTRPRYQTAIFGTPAWDDAAAAYASTPTGRMELMSSLGAAQAADDINSTVAFEHALAQGERLREKVSAFQDALATRATPVVAPAADPEFGFTDDGTSDDFGFYDDNPYGTTFADEEEWEAADRRGWSPAMRYASWDRTDAAFTGCTPEMSSNEFIDQVCENLGVTRPEFESAAAAYLAANRVPIALGSGGPDQALRTNQSVFISPDELRGLLVGNFATPRFSPEQVKEIATLALSAREEAAAAEAAREAAAATTTRASGAPSRAARRYAHQVDLPDDPDELAALSLHDDAVVRAAVAGHPNTAPDTLAVMASEDAVTKVRAAAARNPNLPVPNLLLLVDSRYVAIRGGAARNPVMPESSLRVLASDPNDNVKGAVARNPSAPDDVYASLSESESVTVRKSAARRANIPSEISARFAVDPDQQVRSALAKNRTTPANTVAHLSTDEAQSVRAAAARNPNLAPSLLRGALSRDDAPGVRAAVARNPNASTAVLARLSTDPDPWVRRNVAWNDSTPALLLYALRNDRDPAVVRAAEQRNPQEAP